MKEDWVKAKYCDIIANTDKATLFLFQEREVWMPNKLFRFMEGSYIKIPPFIADGKKLKGVKIKPIIHKPKNIEPIYNQKAIEQLQL